MPLNPSILKKSLINPENTIEPMYFDRELAAWVLMGVMIGLALGYIIGFYIPIPGATHLKTVTTTVINSTTVTEVLNTTKTVTYTTTVNGKVVTMTTTVIEPVTTTSIVNNTITKIIVVPITNTTTKTITSTSLVPYPYTTTVTTTVIENASQLSPLNLTDPLSVLEWAKATYALSAFGIMNLTLPLGFCEGTMWIFPNMSVVWLGAWFIPNKIAQEYMNQNNYLGSFPTGVKEYAYGGLYVPYLGMIDPVSGGFDDFESSSVYILSNAVNYPIPNYTLAILGTNTNGVVPSWGLVQYPFAFKYLNNGTYVMILTNSSPIGPAISLALNPPALCVIQVIRVKPGTPDSYILNMTFLGAQYWAWLVSEAAWGKPAPCYAPASWTYGYWVYNLNNTKPIGANWQYYCGPKGIWLPMKP
jgi:hypothetical protein